MNIVLTPEEYDKVSNLKGSRTWRDIIWKGLDIESEPKCRKIGRPPREEAEEEVNHG